MPKPIVKGPVRTERVICARRTVETRQPVVAARIGAPERRPKIGWMCRVHCPQAFGSDKFIFGIDAAQARALAGEFVMTMLEHHGFVLDPVQRKAQACRARPRRRIAG